MDNHPAVVGIDVGERGFHAVALREGKFLAETFGNPVDLLNWCLEQDAQVIAIDAPCAWSVAGGSRFAERTLEIGGGRIQCFKTPTRSRAAGRAFYAWVFNGEKLYLALAPYYHLFDSTRQAGKIVFETFPNAIVCALAGCVVPARPKAATRRKMLQDKGYDPGSLANIHLVDAALCAVTAEKFRIGKVRCFGDLAEGFIVVPGDEK